MRRNYENGNVEKIPHQRWCSGDSPWLFKERWEKIFEDWVGVKQEKFDPSRVSELYDSVRPAPFTIADDRSNTIVCIIECSCLPSLIQRVKGNLANLAQSIRIDVGRSSRGRSA